MEDFETSQGYYLDRITEGIKKIIPDANDFCFSESGNWVLFKSKGRAKRVKKCVAKYDNNGIKTILKQIDVFSPMRYMINGQPISNCEIIY